mgnify:CR=1 FL=1|jgi:hypothetical protein
MLDKKRCPPLLLAQESAKRQTDTYCEGLWHQLKTLGCLDKNEHGFYNDLINTAKPLFYDYIAKTNQPAALDKFNDAHSRYAGFSGCGAAIVLLKNAAMLKPQNRLGVFARLFNESRAKRVIKATEVLRHPGTERPRNAHR